MNKPNAVAASKLLTVFLMYSFSLLAAAQGVGSVIESQGINLGNQNQAQSAPNSDGLSLLLEQNQQLRAELQALRGIVEEQGFELRKIQRDSLNRYTSTDTRLSAIENGPSSAPPLSNQISPGNIPTPLNDSSEARAQPENPIEDTTTEDAISTGFTRPSSNRGTLQPAVLSEQQLYQMAYDSVINSNFERSIAEFEQYMSVYPSGRFVTNAHYWKGQAYLYLERYTEAIDSYEIILTSYRDSAKLADAMYGLGLAYQGLGNVTQARQLLNEIKRRFPNTGVANLADTKLLQLD